MTVHWAESAHYVSIWESCSNIFVCWNKLEDQTLHWIQSLIDELLGQHWTLRYWQTYKQHIIKIEEETIMEHISALRNNILRKSYSFS